ncbi:MAG: zinc dependent phospholipase C family protein [Nitrospirota bacterium]
MPGSYAHIALVNLASEKRGLSGIGEFPREAIDAANLHVNFLELGCISPDYPYMDITSGDSKKWADAMHYTHTCQAIYVGAALVRKLPEGLEKEKCLAWLMGYTAHVVADMCIHPVVELKVGQYEGNETPHRRCEMHQDAFIFRRIGTGMPQVAGHIKATILTCGASDNPKLLDPDLKKLWQELLRTVYPSAFADEPPDMDKWHRKCYMILEKILPTSSHLIGFARHACDGLGFSYPTPAEIDMGEYIENLKVPGEKHMHYDDIFNFAIERVQQVWLDVTRHALGQGDFLAFRNEEWDLDTGRNKLDIENRLVFWEKVA